MGEVNLWCRLNKVTNGVAPIILALPESAVGMSVAFKPNIDAYFERIGFSGSIAPTLETLTQLHALHPAAIAYENLDPLIGVPVRLDLPNLQQKLVFDRRGGYCFEHNTLLLQVLAALGFQVTPLSARVRLQRAWVQASPTTTAWPCPACGARIARKLRRRWTRCRPAAWTTSRSPRFCASKPTEI